MLRRKLVVWRALPCSGREALNVAKLPTDVIQRVAKRSEVAGSSTDR